MRKKMSLDVFIEKAIKKHGNKYCYSKVYYDGGSNKVCIVCYKHGDFWQQAASHLSGVGCPVCANDRKSLYKKDIASMKKNNIISAVLPSESKYIVLSENGDFCIVDKGDYDYINKYNWCITQQGYAFNNELGLMHRFIMNTPKGMDTDHINRNKLDNRKCNLRVCERMNNTWNRVSNVGKSKYKGVHMHTKCNKWCSQITINKRRISLGLFDTEIEAAKAYDEAAKKLHREFAYLNFK